MNFINLINFDCLNFYINSTLLRDLQTTFDFSELFFSEIETDSNDIFSSDLFINNPEDLKIESSNSENESDNENVDNVDKNKKNESEKKTGYPVEEYFYLGVALVGYAATVWWFGHFWYKIW